MIARVLAAAAVAALVAGSAEAAEFAYSPTNGPGCVKIGSKREFNSWRCSGPAGYAARFFDLGNMVAVELGPSGREKTLVEDSLMWQGAEKSFGDRVEWRLLGGRPYAAILRIRRQDFDEKTSESRDVEEMLVVKVSPQGACRMGVVDTNDRNANAAARDLADSSAAGFQCGTDQPRAIGAGSRSPPG